MYTETSELLDTVCNALFNITQISFFFFSSAYEYFLMGLFNILFEDLHTKKVGSKES